MVKAGDNFVYGKQFFKEGDEIPDSLVPELEKHQPSHLSTFVNVNGTYYKITDPRIKGWVEQRKHLEKRLIEYFKDEKPKEEIVNVSEEVDVSEKPAKKRGRKRKNS